MANEARNLKNQNEPNDGSTSRLLYNKVEETRIEVNEVVDIMKDNVARVLERDDKLRDLEDKANALSMGATRFEKNAGILRRKMWWKNLKMKIILISITAFLLILIIYCIV